MKMLTRKVITQSSIRHKLVDQHLQQKYIETHIRHLSDHNYYNSGMFGL